MELGTEVDLSSEELSTAPTPSIANSALGYQPAPDVAASLPDLVAGHDVEATLRARLNDPDNAVRVVAAAHLTGDATSN